MRAEFYTEPQVEVQIQPLVKVQERVWGSLSAELSSLRVTERVTGYKRLALDGDTVLGYEALDLPPVSFDTLGIWVHLPRSKAKTRQNTSARFMVSNTRWSSPPLTSPSAIGAISGARGTGCSLTP